ncbi:MAG: class I SAM-dependent methyltransferase [Leptolyngbyaceae bacterium]|nr:class I SAM-dependent methyltransferase [Leptolyngbyaceae bacterium]
MAKGKSQSDTHGTLANFLSQASDSQWNSTLSTVAQRFSREYRGDAFSLPDEVEAMPIFREWTSGALAPRIASPFWEVAKPKKNQHCLDIGCGVSFLIYPWREWEALFYGQEISAVARDALVTRAPQLNSKLFKGVKLAPAHQLEYEPNQFDVAIATGFSCYYPITYWKLVMDEVRRVLKPDGIFVFDVINPDAEIAENWAILETYLGAEVFLESLDDWKEAIKAAQGKILKQQEGELFQLYKVKFSS